MGHVQAKEMQQHLVFEAALRWHLRSNHYPPVPDAMFDPCVAAIEAARDEDWDRPIDLTGVAKYRGHDSAPAWALVEAHHLGDFLDE